ncbi:MAG: hypothetical protein IKF01_01240 [Bacilli bacterium]|nr:hypothetical protein [Bacilli bacterium]
MEKTSENNLFFVCSLIEYIARKTKNTKKYIVQKLGKDKVSKIYDLAEVYHSENIDKVTDELIKELNIDEGSYVLNIKNGKPTFWELGRIYQRLILKKDKNPDMFIDNLIIILTSFIIPKLDNYDSSLYYENIDYLYECLISGKVL